MKDPTHPNRSIWSFIANLTTRHAIAVVVVATILAVVSTISVTRLRPVASIESMLADDQPSTIAMRRISDHFGTLEELIILVSAPSTLSDSDASETLLRFAERLKDRIETSDTLAAMCDSIQFRPTRDMRAYVESIVIPHALLYLDKDTLASFFERLTPDAMRMQLVRTEEMLAIPGAGGSALRKAAISDPLALRDFLIAALPLAKTGDAKIFESTDGFFSKDRRHLLIRLHGTHSASDLEFAKAFTQSIQQAADLENQSDLELAYTGSYAIATTAAQSIRMDMIRSITLSVLFLQFLYLAAYRSFWSLPAALAPVALGLLFAFGAFSAMGMNLSPMTAVIGAILAGLGIDYSIHCLTHYQSIRTAGADHPSAMRKTLTEIGPALIAACLTTTIGFLAISQSSVQALKEFGLLGGMGLVASLLAAILVLPTILALAAKRTERIVAGKDPHVSVVSHLLRHCVRHRWKYMMTGAVTTGLAVVALTTQTEGRALFEDDLTVMHPRPNPALDVQKQLSEWFEMAPDSLLVHLSADSEESLVSLSHRVDDAVAGVAGSSATIRGTFGLSSLLPDPSIATERRQVIAQADVEQILKNFDEAVAASHFNPDAFGAYKQFLRTLFTLDAAPSLTDLGRYPSLADAVLPIHVGEVNPQQREAITAVISSEPLDDRSKRDDAIHSIRNAMGAIEGATLSGMSVIGYDTESRIKQDLSRLISIAALAVGVWLLLYFRSPLAALLAFLPALFGMIVLLLMAMLLDLKLNTMNLIALPLLVGIGVDDGIFLVTAARASKKNNDNHHACINRLSTGCHAVGMTSLTTLLTFGTLAFTSTPAIRSLGMLMAIGVSASFVGSICILAPLLVGHRLARDT